LGGGLAVCALAIDAIAIEAPHVMRSETSCDMVDGLRVSNLSAIVPAPIITGQ
jgi:hypothetical protein